MNIEQPFLKKRNRRKQAVLLFVFVMCFIAQAATISSVNYAAKTVTGNDVVISTSGSGKVCITICHPDVARIWVESSGTFSKDASYSVEKETWDPVSFTVNDKGQYVQILTSDMSIRINKTPLGISFYHADDATLILQEKTGGGIGLGQASDDWNMASDEHIFGTGEDNDNKQNGGALDRRGTTRNLATGMQLNDNSGPCANIPVPFFMSTGKSGNGYGLFYDNQYVAKMDFGASSNSTNSWSSGGGENVFYFFNGPAFSKILDRYTELTGRPSMLPLWVMGYSQSKCWYTSWSVMDAVLNPIRAANIPIDAMILDMQWANCYFDFQWANGSGYNNGNFGGNATSTAKLASLKASGTKVMVINDPMMDPTCSANYSEALSKGFLAKCGSGQCQAGWFKGDLMDPTTTGFSDWLWADNRVGGLYKQGIAGWWLDLTEPEGLPANSVYSAGSWAKIHNVYSNLYSKAYYDGQKKKDPNSRPYILTRCGFAGIQKYGVGIWTGDIHCTYGVLAGHVPASQSCALSGINWWANDIGGFTGGCYKGDCSAGGAQGLLYQRWMQFSCFVGITRAHSNNACSPTQYGAGVQAVCKKYISLRYRFLPYIYSYAHQCEKTGAPIQRPLVFDYQNDATTYNQKTEFCFGKELLVAPVVDEGATTKQVYFPEGTWFDYEKGTAYAGKTTATVLAPLEKIPLFVKAGAIIPMAPLMMYTDEKKWDPITLDIYPSGTSSFTLYQDDGKTMDYRSNAKFTETSINCKLTDSKSVVVTLAESNKLFTPSTYEFSIHLPAQTVAPAPVQWNGLTLVSTSAQTSYTSATSGYYWDASAKILWVKANASQTTNQMVTVSLDGQPIVVTPTNSVLNIPACFDLRTGSIKNMSISFAVPKNAGAVKIELFDIQGKRIKNIVNEILMPGYYTKSIENGTKNHLGITKGKYLCRMRAAGYEKTIVLNNVN